MHMAFPNSYYNNINSECKIYINTACNTNEADFIHASVSLLTLETISLISLAELGSYITFQVNNFKPSCTHIISWQFLLIASHRS